MKANLIPLIVSLITLTGFYPAAAAAEVVFVGKPFKRANLSESQVAEASLDDSKASEYLCVITRQGENFFWTSRQNKPLVRSRSGVFVTFHATDGSGYIRLFYPKAASHLDLDEEASAKLRAANMVYMEHLLVMLGSVNYYGSSVSADRSALFSLEP